MNNTERKASSSSRENLINKKIRAKQKGSKQAKEDFSERGNFPMLPLIVIFAVFPFYIFLKVAKAHSPSTSEHFSEDFVFITNGYSMSVHLHDHEARSR